MTATDRPSRPRLDHMTDDDLDALYARLDALEQPAPASLRDQYAEALRSTPRADCADWPPNGAHGPGHAYDIRCALCTYDVEALAGRLAAVRDTEMQQLRARVAELEQALADADATQLHTDGACEAVQRAETAEAAIDRVRAVAPMLDALDTLIATSSRDWGQYRVDAWLWAVLCGWDCEDDHVHDDLCDDGAAMAEMQERHGWSDETVAKARRYRAAVREVVAALDGPARPGPQP